MSCDPKKAYSTCGPSLARAGRLVLGLVYLVQWVIQLKLWPIWPSNYVSVFICGLALSNECSFSSIIIASLAYNIALRVMYHICLNSGHFKLLSQPHYIYCFIKLHRTGMWFNAVLQCWNRKLWKSCIISVPEKYSMQHFTIWLETDQFKNYLQPYFLKKPKPLKVMWLKHLFNLAAFRTVIIRL